MKSHNKSIHSTAGIFSVVILTFLLLVFSTTGFAQKALLAEAADIDQCRNGPAATPVVCTGSAWVNGNANSIQAHWAESQFLAYRIKLSDLTPGPTVNTLTIGYDIFGSGKHAIDYLGTYNATETTADPCSGIVGCVLGSPTSTFPIPADTVTVTNQINPNTSLPIVQTPGQFTMWGANILSVAYEPYGGGDERKITVTFTSSVTNPVIAWGGHIAWIGDWGVGNSASSISGSPYHMRLDNLNGSGGNQDRALQAAAVIPSGAVFVKKVVNTLDNSGDAVFAFPFTATANFGSTAFSLIDDNAGPGIDTKGSQAIISFGAGNTITVTEGTNPTGWTLANVNCVESGLQDSTKNSIGPAASVIVQVGEAVTCTFTNTQFQPSASLVTVGGRVFNQFGRALSRVTVTITDMNGGSRSATTGAFGYYQFEDVEAGQVYVITASGGRHTFQSQIVSVSDEIIGFDIISNE